MTKTTNIMLQGWLGDLPTQLSTDLLALGEPASFAPDEFVYRIDDTSQSLWCVVQGAVRMNIATFEQEHRFAHMVGPGQWFGEYELLTAQPRIIELQAACDSRLMCYSASGIRALARHHPDLWRWIGVLSAQHTLLAISAGDDLMIRDSVQRTAATLLRLSGQRGAHPATVPLADLPVSQQNLTEIVNISRSSLSIILRKMAQDGILKLEYKWIRILDSERLSAIVG